MNQDETGRDLLSYSQNTLKILLGFSLVFEYEALFNQIVDQLGEEAISPFSSDFNQCKIDYNP